MKILTPERLTEIRAADQAATPGPWRAEHSESWDDERDETIDCGFPWTNRMVDCHDYHTLRWEDAQFCVLARTAVPELLEEVERLQNVACASLQNLQTELERAADLERQLDHERILRRRAEGRVVAELSEHTAREVALMDRDRTPRRRESAGGLL